MPWKGEKDPYKIWLSEIILQQTRVEQGLAYYEKILKAFPTVKKLAKADDNQVFKLWEGLGYYTRCRNLLETARFIADKRKGVFPPTYDEIRQLKGVGSYTAAAISSFAFNLPYAVVDGNVFRVLARVFGIDAATDSTEGKKLFTELAESLLDKKKPGIYNQAIMDFGAVICKPLAPRCSTCPFKKTCAALATGSVSALPVKKKKITITQRWFYYFIPEYRGKLPISIRQDKDIWQGLAEFPLLETNGEQSVKALLKMAEKKGFLPRDGYKLDKISPLYRQTLSHQLIAGQFISVKLKKKPSLIGNWVWIEQGKLSEQAFPQFINQFLKAEATQAALF